MEGLTGVASFVLFFPDAPANSDVSFWEVNIDGHYPIAMESGSGMAPYFGGGINIAHASVSVDVPLIGTVEASDTDLGLNLLAGATFKPMGNMVPFAEIKLEFGGGEQFVICGGFYF
jgi:opacity protein-like surface antigen